MALLLKPYEGTAFRRGIRIENVRFYDEREWHYVPSIEHGWQHLLPFDFQDFARRDAANSERAELFCLPFDPSDIKYIVVSSETEILPMIRSVKRIKIKYTEEEIRVLISRIVSAEQIASDF